VQVVFYLTCSGVISLGNTVQTVVSPLRSHLDMSMCTRQYVPYVTIPSLLAAAANAALSLLLLPLLLLHQSRIRRWLDRKCIRWQKCTCFL